MTATPPAPPLADLYAADEVAWYDRMAALARAGRGDLLDLPNLAEELDLMGKSERRAVRSRLETLICHRLKWDFQPAKRSGSWWVTISRDTRYLAETFADSRTLRNHASDVLGDVYQRAVGDAVKETRLPRSTFPADCPYTLTDLTTEVAADPADLPD